MTNKQIMGYFLTILKLNDDPKVYSYIMDSTKFNPSVLYKYFLTDIAKDYGLDPCFYFDEEGILIILDHIVLPTYDEFRYALSENVTDSIIDNQEHMYIVYTLFSDFGV